MLIQKGKDVLLSIRVAPNAKRSGIEGIWQESMLKIALRAPAVDGKANEALIDFLSNFFHIKKRAIIIVRGETAREKTILLQNCNQSDIQQIIAPLCEKNK